MPLIGELNMYNNCTCIKAYHGNLLSKERLKSFIHSSFVFQSRLFKTPKKFMIVSHKGEIIATGSSLSFSAHSFRSH